MSTATRRMSRALLSCQLADGRCGMKQTRNLALLCRVFEAQPIVERVT
jgi:hypothetical protein